MGKVINIGSHDDFSIRRLIREASEREIEDSITDEMVVRVLNPVLEMILAGKFHKKSRPKWYVTPLPQMAAMAALTFLIVITAFSLPSMETSLGSVSISKRMIPLAASPGSDANIFSGRIVLPDGSGVSDMEVHLVQAGTESIWEISRTDQNGQYVFTDFPDNDYHIRICLPGGMETEGLTEAGFLKLAEQDTFSFGRDSIAVIKNNEVKIWEPGQ